MNHEATETPTDPAAKTCVPCHFTGEPPRCIRCGVYDRQEIALRNALSSEADAVRRAESAEMGCEIAYRREPTQAEGDAAESSDAPRGGECFVAMGGWTGRRCRACDRWVWGGPTACEGCVRREERDDARDCGQDDVCASPPGCQRHWEGRNGELVRERDAATARAEAAERRVAELEVALWDALRFARSHGPGDDYEIERLRAVLRGSGT